MDQCQLVVGRQEGTSGVETEWGSRLFMYSDWTEPQ